MTLLCCSLNLSKQTSMAISENLNWEYLYEFQSEFRFYSALARQIPGLSESQSFSIYNSVVWIHLNGDRDPGYSNGMHHAIIRLLQWYDQETDPPHPPEASAIHPDMMFLSNYNIRDSDILLLQKKGFHNYQTLTRIVDWDGNYAPAAADILHLAGYRFQKIFQDLVHYIEERENGNVHLANPLKFAAYLGDEYRDSMESTTLHDEVTKKGANFMQLCDVVSFQRDLDSW